MQYIATRRGWLKSNVCHQVKEQGDIGFLIAILESNVIRDYYIWQQYRESFYLLAMVDYLSRENQILLCNDYDDLRHQKMQEPLYPASVLVTASTKSRKERYQKPSQNFSGITS